MKHKSSPTWTQIKINLAKDATQISKRTILPIIEALNQSKLSYLFPRIELHKQILSENSMSQGPPILP